MARQARRERRNSQERVPGAPGAVERERVVRLRRPTRDRVTPVPVHLDAVLAEDHLARLLWQVVEQLDLTVFVQALKVVEGGPGRSAADPRLLVALWLYATSQGVTSGRVLDRLCVEHLAYLWLCGGVSMNYHTLNDFRVQHGAALDELFTQVVGRLQQVGLVDLDHVAQDGIRVRASAGAASFRRQPTLERCLAEAQAVLAAVQADATTEPQDAPRSGPPPSAQQRAARERAARERLERLEAALAAMPAAQAAKALVANSVEQSKASPRAVRRRSVSMPKGLPIRGPAPTPHQQHTHTVTWRAGLVSKQHYRQHSWSALCSSALTQHEVVLYAVAPTGTRPQPVAAERRAEDIARDTIAA